jgi:hypothetical protein
VLLRLAPNVSRDAHDERKLALDEIEQETAGAGDAARGEPLGKTRLVGDACELRSQKSTEGFIKRSTSASTGLSLFLISRLPDVTNIRISRDYGALRPTTCGGGPVTPAPY